MKKIRNWVQAEFGGFLLALVLRLLYWSIRWQKHPLLLPDAAPIKGPRIYVFWHNRQVMMPCLCRTAIRHGKMRDVVSLSSAHRDGRIVARATAYMGLESVSGSSTRGGVEALVKLIRLIHAGKNLAITPDGPRGPVYKVKLGVLKAAQRGGAPIFPCAYAVSSFWRLKSWDGLIIPKPFSRGVAVVGDALEIPPNISEEELLKFAERLERRLMSVTERADAAVGLPAKL